MADQNLILKLWVSEMKKSQELSVTFTGAWFILFIIVNINSVEGRVIRTDGQFGHEKGLVKLIQRVKIAHSVLHIMSKLFHPIIFSSSG